MPSGYAALEPFADRVERVLALAPEPLVPCHNDLLAANVLDDGGDLRIIDYEYSGMNEPSFELGDAIAEAGLGVDALVELCAGLLRPARRRTRRPGRAVGVDGPLRLDPVGDDPGRHERDRVRLLGVVDGQAGARPSSWPRSPRFDELLSRAAAR